MKRLISLAVVSIMTIAFVGSCSKKGFEEDGMIFIPAGEFTLGSEDKATLEGNEAAGLRKKQWFADARPVQKMHLDGYFIDKFEATNREYKRYIYDVGGKLPQDWDSETKTYPEGDGDLPIDNITWFDANNYCRYMGKELPSEFQWEKAAKGLENNKYSWGSVWEDGSEGLAKNVSPVGTVKIDKSYYGLYDMTANVSEWTKSYYKPYTGNTDRLIDYGEEHRVIRGGSSVGGGHHIYSPIMGSNSYRKYYIPGGAGNDGGVRCAKSLSETLPDKEGKKVGSGQGYEGLAEKSKVDNSKEYEGLAERNKIENK